MSNPPPFIWEPEPLLLDVDPVFGLSNTFSNLFLLSPALPRVHYTTGLNGPWAEQIYARLPQQLPTLQPTGLPFLLVYSHRVDPNAPLGSFENPYSSSNAPPLPQPRSNSLSFSSYVGSHESFEATNNLESLEPRPSTPPKRSHRQSSDDRQQYHNSPIQLEFAPSTPPPMPANQSRNTQPIPHTRNRSRCPSSPQLRPRPQEISTPHRPPPVLRYTRRVHFAASDRSIPPRSPSPSPSSPTPPSSVSGSPPPSCSRSPFTPPLQHHSPPYSPLLPPYSSPSLSPRSSTSYSVRSYKWPVCMLCARKPATIEDEDLRLCKACWEEATDAEGNTKRGRWWRDA